jgi:hypothetical protein
MIIAGRSLQIFIEDPANSESEETQMFEVSVMLPERFVHPLTAVVFCKIRALILASLSAQVQMDPQFYGHQRHRGNKQLS